MEGSPDLLEHTLPEITAFVSNLYMVGFETPKISSYQRAPYTLLPYHLKHVETYIYIFVKEKEQAISMFNLYNRQQIQKKRRN